MFPAKSLRQKKLSQKKTNLLKLIKRKIKLNFQKKHNRLSKSKL